MIKLSFDVKEQFFIKYYSSLDYTDSKDGDFWLILRYGAIKANIRRQVIRGFNG